MNVRTLYDDIRAPKKPVRWSSLLPPVITLLAAAALILLFQFLQHQKAAMNWFILHITTPFKLAISKVFDFIPISVAELIWAIAILSLLGFVIRTVWLLITRDEKLLRLLRRLIALAAAVALVYVGYTTLWGVNYYGDDFSDKSGIVTRGASMEELATLNAAFVQQLNRLAGEVKRDQNGVFNMEPDEIFSRTEGLYEGIEVEFPFLAAPERTPKRMIAGGLMSRMGFTGFFFPFTGEINLNDDAPACLLPSTILHEIAHQRNIAGEDECNFVAIIAGLRCDDEVYTYSSTLLGYIHLGNALYSVSPETYYAIRADLDPRVEADLAANNAYWDQFDSELEQAVEEVSTTVYEGFLQSFDQKDGMKSYGKCVDLLVAYYFDHQWAE